MAFVDASRWGSPTQVFEGLDNHIMAIMVRVFSISARIPSRKWMPEIGCRLPKEGIRIRRSSPGQALLLPQLNAVDLENLMTVAASKLGSLAIIVDDHQTDTFFFFFGGGGADRFEQMR